MSFSYDGRPSDNDIDKVRFLIQDTAKDGSHLISNEEIQFALDLYSDNINASCASLCDVLAARYAKKQEITSSNYRQNVDSIYKKYRDLANRFRVNSVSSSHFKAPAISKSAKDTIEGDSDRVEPSFRRGLFDNPLVSDDNDNDAELT